MSSNQEHPAALPQSLQERTIYLPATVSKINTGPAQYTAITIQDPGAALGGIRTISSGYVTEDGRLIIYSPDDVASLTDVEMLDRKLQILRQVVADVSGEMMRPPFNDDKSLTECSQMFHNLTSSIFELELMFRNAISKMPLGYRPKGDYSAKVESHGRKRRVR